MKKVFFFFCFLTIVLVSQAQTGVKLPALDKSPMDMAYYPPNYPVLRIQDKATEPLTARVIYSRPQKNGRNIFGELVEYEQVWRLGANEATEIEFFKDVKIGNKKIAKGKYTMYAVVHPTSWDIILNKDTDIWGAFKYDSTKDVVRINVPVQKTTDVADAFTITFATGADLIMAWDNIMAALPIAFK
ncbi:MAG: hypothetical protein C4329_12230 [Chitinophagaceae bacterium]